MSLLSSLPPVIQPQPFHALDAAPVQDHAEEKQPCGKIIVIHSKDVSSEERKIFQFWGKVLVWDSRYINIPLEKLPYFDYLFIDMRLKDARYALGSINLSSYSTVAYVPWYHKEERFIEQLAAMAMTSFPLRAISKEDFDRQLLCEKVRSPSIARSFLAAFLPCLSA
jgi:hypothetical protein